MNSYKVTQNKIKSQAIKVMVVCIIVFMQIIAPSCKKFLAVDLNKTKIEKANVFSDDITAKSAITGMYVTLLSTTGFAAGDLNSVMALAGLSADELQYQVQGPPQAILYKQFENNQLTVDNELITKLWVNMYMTIFQANSIIEGLGASTRVTLPTRNQLRGEALFVRAFTYFYLVNLFGPVPLVETTNYKVNSVIARSEVEEVYLQMEQDLTRAKELLSDSYPTPERIRPNNATACALLARVYLFQGKWDKAIQESTTVIDNSKYQLSMNLSDVFRANSNEAIWQLKPNTEGKNTNEGALLILPGPPNIIRPFSLHNSVVSGFESGDLRYANWIGVRSVGANTYYYSFKYKVRFDPILKEYSMVMRLSEQHLIRAEARVNKGDLVGAIHDLDLIRGRAGLSLINSTNPSIGANQLLLAIEKERKLELFAEWGHRWLDIKRTQRIHNLLSPIKPQWSPTDALYPLPQSEFANNPNLGSQNEGY